MSDTTNKSNVETVEDTRSVGTSNQKSRLSGPLLVAAITSVCSSGFLLFGYDQGKSITSKHVSEQHFLTISGVMSGVVISHYWLSQMGNPSTIMVSTITALYDVGAVFGAIGAAIVGDKLGRKRTLMLGCTVLIIGSILMATCFERIQMMFGRILTGLGIGFITSGKSCYSSLLLRRRN